MPTLVNMIRADRMIQFIETLRIPEGMDYGKPFLLRDWQKAIIRDIYAPVDDEGYRIVRKVIYSVAKKNGKTPLVAGIVLGHLIGPESKTNEQLYSAAFERAQAAITYDYMVKMIKMDEELKEATIIRETKNEIEGRYTHSKYKALSAEAKSKHGISPAVLVFDELAQFGASDKFFNSLSESFGAHAEPLFYIMSTQAEDDLAILSLEIDYALKYGDDDPSVRLFLYTAPEQDENKKPIDILDRKYWDMANPALGDFLSLKDFEASARQASRMPSKEGNFRNLKLNQRIAATERFMSKSVWDANNGAPDISSLEKGFVTAGLDLAKKNDLAALVIDGYHDGYHNLFPYFWKPKDTLLDHKKRDRVPYDVWEKQGFLETSEGSVIDFIYIAKKIVEFHWLYGIDELRFDRHKIDDLIVCLDFLECESFIKGKEERPSDKALCLVNHGQGFVDMNKAIESTEDVFLQSRARHGDHPVLYMCAVNAVTDKDHLEQRRFAKLKATGRIDGMVALAMALRGAGLPEEKDEQDWEIITD